VTLAQAQVTGLTSALTGKVETTDPRLSDARVPTAHHVTHESGGSDAIAALSAAVLTNGTLPDARLSSNVARRDQANTFTHADQRIVTAYAQVGLQHTPSPVNARGWSLVTNGDTIQLSTRDDAWTQTGAPFVAWRNGDIDVAGRLQVNGQIAFPATANPSSNVNTLDDYEEGPWTPQLHGSGGFSGQSYAIQQGEYWKCGRRCFATGRLQLSVLGTLSGFILIGNLPFLSANLYMAGDVRVPFFSGLGTPVVGISGYVAYNTTTAYLMVLTAANSGNAYMAPANLSASADLHFAIDYLTAN
jgi:hypothetical protein